MTKKLSSRDAFLLVFLVVLIVGSCWYMFFYTPLQEEIMDIQSKTAQLDTEIATATAKVSKMKAMQDEVDTVLAQPADQITEIAPYDNATVVIAQLNGILAASEEYSLTFRDVAVNDDGTVRRVINMSFKCEDYASARSIVNALSKSHWRCIVNSVTVSVPSKEIERGEVADVMAYPVEVTAQVTFFESKNLS